MEVGILTLQTLFQKQARYEIPEFQRRYIWNQEEQWEPLWQDVQAIAESILEVQRGNSPDPAIASHFMGAVVLQEQSTVTSDGLDRRIVVDGQQRLTTLQLLLDAVQEKLEEHYTLPAARLSTLVLNQEAYRGGDPDNAFKVWPTTGDQEAFRHAMQNELESEGFPDSLIVRCHEFFKLQVQQWLDSDPNESQIRANAIEEAIARKFELVVLDLAKEDNPHIIFETLNARGTQLLESDLVKNLVLYEAERAGISGDVNALWGFTDNWWNQDIRQGRLIRRRIEAFLNYWLVLRTLREINADRVFAEFRGYVNRNESYSIGDIANDIRSIGQVYRKLEEKAYPERAHFLSRWKVMEMGVLTPVLLWLFSRGVPDDQLTKALKALESYLIRRMLCRMSTMGTNRLFLELIAGLDRECIERAGDYIAEFLGGQTAQTRTWPDNHQIEQVFLQSPLYSLLTRARLRMVEALEISMRTDKSETKAVAPNLTIEHIMPQDWQENWPLPEDVENKALATSDRNRIIHSIGNLTLVNNRLNPSLSNSPWDEKRTALDHHTTLFLNKSILESAPDKWDESAIEQRAHYLYHMAVEIWPYADEL